MADSRCLVLGADSDIGRAIAHRFGSEGFDLYLTTRKIETVDHLWTNSLEDTCKIRITWFYFEGLDFDAHLAFYQQLSVPPNVVVCAIGYLGNHRKAYVDFTEAVRIINSNYTMQVSILNIVAQDMQHRKKGMIIGISSVAGDRGRKSNYIYGSAKAAFSTYLSGLRNRLFNDGVHVLTIIPGYVRTKMTKDMSLPKWLATDPDRLAYKVYKAYTKKRNVVYCLPVWKWIMFSIKCIPESLFKRLDL